MLTLITHAGPDSLLSGESPEFTPPAGMRRLAGIFWSESLGHVSTLGPDLTRRKSVQPGA